MKISDAAILCKALGDSKRLQILQMLIGNEQCACMLLEHFEITQPTLAHHMKILCDCDLVKTRKDGKWTHYSINKATFGACLTYLNRYAQETPGKETDSSCDCI